MEAFNESSYAATFARKDFALAPSSIEHYCIVKACSANFT